MTFELISFIHSILTIFSADFLHKNYVVLLYHVEIWDLQQQQLRNTLRKKLNNSAPDWFIHYHLLIFTAFIHISHFRFYFILFFCYLYIKFQLRITTQKATTTDIVNLWYSKNQNTNRKKYEISNYSCKENIFTFSI